MRAGQKRFDYTSNKRKRISVVWITAIISLWVKIEKIQEINLNLKPAF